MKKRPTSTESRPRRRQGRLLAFSMTGAMALALTSCDNATNQGGQPMIVPPTSFNTNQATAYANTNQAPVASSLHASSGCNSYLCGHGYYPVYGYPGYFYRPTPGSSVELVTGGSSDYSASSPEEARANVARGGFGAGGEGEGHGGGFGGGE